jgi:hypothetical protein
MVKLMAATEFEFTALTGWDTLLPSSQSGDGGYSEEQNEDGFE